ncbi:hypothetical protein B0A52_05171 [Exophiala mesophila]|uniref:CMP/dCMP-type deaminase domain-containing protein n=1 Tax=Exophiala mesophila TaxID=212818 RepID=A0A438N444_EXOME|nr:hypothetical protein B0A52_05171 [Exophiala mesophila]
MSYQSFLRSASGAGMSDSTASTARSPSSPTAVQQKPTRSNPSPGPVSSNPPTSSIHNVVTRNAPPASPNNPTRLPATPTPAVRSSALRSNPITSAPPPYDHTTTSTTPPAASQPSAVAPGSTPPPDPMTRSPLTKEQIDAALKQCLSIQTTATFLHDKRPFAALLLAPNNTSVLLTHFSISHVQHAESELARLATIHFSQKFLAACTLVSTWEPCAMCAGTIYWSNIGRLLYAASESTLKDLTGAGNEENMTLSLPCRTVLEAGQKDVEIIGPVPQWEDQVAQESGKWWNDHPAPSQTAPRAGSVNGSVKPGSISSASLQHGTPTTWTGEDSVLSSINDEGEYKAELDIDWMR